METSLFPILGKVHGLPGVPGYPVPAVNIPIPGARKCQKWKSKFRSRNSFQYYLATVARYKHMAPEAVPGAVPRVIILLLVPSGTFLDSAKLH
eukprot:1282901-Rhodomonas_salina.2